MTLSTYYYIWSLSVFVFNIRIVLSGYEPSFTNLHEIGSLETGALTFPDSLGRTANCPVPSHFIGAINFINDTENLLIGSADVLYMLNGSTLNCQANYSWQTNEATLTMCRNQDQGDVCRNYIRLYEVLPSDHLRLLVCGTQSSNSPQCRTVEFTDHNFTSATEPFSASDGLISNYPELPSFGEFRHNGDSDTTYFSGGFYESDGSNTNIGRDFNITFHNITFNSNNGNLVITERFSVKNDPLWLNFPVTFVDYYRADYGDDFEFYFVFLRETILTSGQSVIYSRVVRICRNDPGSNGRFTTFIKARIFCEREVPPGREFVGSIDYQYNEITGMVFNEDGRYGENKDWSKLMYGAFSGPRTGPRGTAICVYRADIGEFNRGIFDIFREDLVRVLSGSMMDVQNSYLMCSPEGRPEEFSDDVLIVQEVTQIGNDPLLVLDGITVSKMVLDRICIIRSSDSSKCVNQDVLFMGTDSGKILKVVLGSLSQDAIEPVISEEISLESVSRVDDMVIKEIQGQKSLLVSTSVKIYNLPLERCSRFQGCRDCIAARDPYCIWNNQTGVCEKNNLSVQNDLMGDVPEWIWQNIHTGTVNECNALPICQVSAESLDHETIICSGSCNNTDSISISTSLPLPNRENCSVNRTFYSTTQGCVQFTSNASLGLHSYECIVESKFIESVKTLPGPPVPFESGVYTSCGRTSCILCVQMVNLTDFFNNYVFQVYYSTMPNTLFETTPPKRLSEGSDCVLISELPPGSLLNYIVELSNNISGLNSSLLTANVQDGFSDPVQNLQATMVTNVSVNLTWSSPSSTNGTIVGFSIQVNGVSEISCAGGFTGYNYEINDLIPFTSYYVTIRGCTGAGESNMPARINFTTSCGISKPVSNVSTRDVSFNNITFQWNRPVEYYGDINDIQYKVSICIYRIDGLVEVERTVNESFYILSDGLLPVTLCCAEIRAITTCGVSHLLGLPFIICDRTQEVAIPGVVSNLVIPADSIGTTSFHIRWAPPLNLQTVPNITYIVVLNNNRTYSLVDITFLHVNNLSPCTQYEVSVKVESGPDNSTLVRTKSLLPPPEIVTFLSSNDILVLTWTIPSVCEDSFTYKVYWNCNQFSGTIDVESERTNANIPTSGFGIGWCVARVQTCIENRCGNLSIQATVSIHQFPPPEPVCFLPTIEGSNATIPVAISDPFITNNSFIEWALYNRTSSMISNSTFNLQNFNLIINFTVESNSLYNFSLRACNIFGCSQSCEREFDTFDNPSPPQGITVTNTTNTSVVLNWRSMSAQNYSISLTGSCLPGSRNILTSKPFYTLDRLCPNSDYNFAIRAIDLQVNKSSLYSDIESFTTLQGIPSEPRFINSSVLDVYNKMLIITWIIPSELNGFIDYFEIKWTLSTKECDQTNQGVLSHNTTNNYTFEHISNVSDIINVKSYSICVRAVTTAQTFGYWGKYSNVRGNQVGLSSQMQDCNTLTSVACIAGLTVVSSLVMSIILSVTIVQKGLFCKNEVHNEKTAY